jgi:microcystin-dependent protein
MIDPFIGEIALFAGNFAPQGWFFCDGSLLQVTQYQALYSILGTTYGGNGTTTFGLPDLRGRVPISFGQCKDINGNNLSNYTLGQRGGNEGGPLTIAQMPAHTHPLNASSLSADQPGPAGNVLATEPTGSSAMYHAMPTNTALNAAAVGTVGGAQPVDNRQPYTAINYIIALVGVYPSRP